jgi:hypothetical protein
MFSVFRLLAEMLAEIRTGGLELLGFVELKALPDCRVATPRANTCRNRKSI